MAYSIKGSTARLVELTGLDARKQIDSSDAEIYRVYETIIALQNRLYNGIGRDAYQSATWTLDAALLDALRVAMADNVGNYAAEEIAYVLLRTSCQDEATLSALHAWDAIVFKWKRAGYTAQSILDNVLASGIVAQAPADGAHRIEAWLDNPTAISSASFSVPFALFGERRVFYCGLEDNGFSPAHHEMFAKFAASAEPSVDIVNARQSVDRAERFKETQSTVTLRSGDPASFEEAPVLSDEGAHWVVQYELNGAQRGFFARCTGSWMDVDGVFDAFAKLMFELNRPERAFQFAIDRGESGAHGSFIAADADRFVALAKTLFIPLKFIATPSHTTSTT